jgi:hypothetical protein
VIVGFAGEIDYPINSALYLITKKYKKKRKKKRKKGYAINTCMSK